MGLLSSLSWVSSPSRTLIAGGCGEGRNNDDRGNHAQRVRSRDRENNQTCVNTRAVGLQIQRLPTIRSIHSLASLGDPQLLFPPRQPSDIYEGELMNN